MMKRSSIKFTQCPECSFPIGTRGLARHREQAHGVAPAAGKRQAAARREARELLKMAGGDRELVLGALDKAVALGADKAETEMVKAAPAAPRRPGSPPRR